MKSKLTFAALLQMESQRTKSKKSSCRWRFIAASPPPSTVSELPERCSRSRVMAEENIGFIGVGKMGGRLARRLIDGGYPLTIFDTSEAAVKSFVELGARSAASAAAVASACEVVITCLPTPQIVQKAALGPGGVVEGTRVKIFIDMS